MNATVQRRIGLISDTHGLLRPAALAFLEGVELIIHGGDIGSAEILETLSTIAPVTAVRGNNDEDDWADGIRMTEVVSVGDVRIFVIHDLKGMHAAPAFRGIDVVVSGHSHKPKIERREGMIFINPGSAGPRRFTLPVCVGELILGPGGIGARIVELPGGRAQSRHGCVRRLTWSI